MAQVESGLGQLRLGLLAGDFHLIDSPLHVFALCLKIGVVFGGIFRRLGQGGRRGLIVRVFIMANNSGTRAPSCKSIPPGTGTAKCLAPIVRLVGVVVADVNFMPREPNVA